MTERPTRILALEDSESDYELMKRELRRVGLDKGLVHAWNRETYISELDQSPDIVLLDYSIPGFSGLEALSIARDRLPLVPVIIVSGMIGEETATEAMRSGATDYVLKGRLDRLGMVIQRALKESEETAFRKRAEEQLAETKDRLEAIVGQMPTALLVFESKEDGISIANEESYRLFGLPRNASSAELRSYLRDVNIVHTDGTPYTGDESPIRQSMRSGQVVRGLVAIIERPDGSRFYASMSVAPVRDVSGAIVGCVAMMADISAQMEMQSKIRSQAEELARSNKELEQFAYVASHDLQEPLRMVTGYLSLLKSRAGDKLNDKEKEYITTAVDGASHMKELIDDLLEYSRVQSSYRPRSDVNMRKAAEMALDNLKGAIIVNKARVEIGELPVVTADGVQMIQLFQNLISNGVKFHSDRPPEVRISCAEGESLWTFVVEDNGIGIAPEYQKRIFEMFQRLHGRDKYPGTGIGLAIAKRIVERHGGTIWVESEEGLGSKFKFTLPKTPTDSTEQ
ncbi:MAG TPA: ATP-binding protein [Methanomassiliicoccales archaeon]|jgi:PAS domain S-box-containing protein|nr:ATP-binding protein [Methanomassiliicoccales archaeon]